MKYQSFIFDDYAFDQKSGVLTLHYSIDDAFHFTETYTFEFEPVTYDEQALDRAIQNLFFIAGVSYYKTFVPPKIIVNKGEIDRPTAEFLNKTYQKGLGEFWYVNDLDPETPTSFPVNSEALQPLTHEGNGMLVGVGGGKDSLVSIELLQAQTEIETWSLNHREQLEPLVNTIGTKHYFVAREWDPQLKSLSDKGALNGHVPISAIFAAVGTITAILRDKQDVVTSNEQSANEATLTYKGVEINHQYSKSQNFEVAYQGLLKRHFGQGQRYYSFLRPLSELHIAEIFVKIGFEKYKHVFSSCNRAYTHDSNHIFWCGVCPKCAFTFLILTPFLAERDLESLWGGKNLLLDPELEGTYRQLLGIEGDKPLECVGEVKESRAAMKLAQQIYPELSDKYSFELPEDYDYQKLHPHAMPPEIYKLFEAALTEL